MKPVIQLSIENMALLEHFALTYFDFLNKRPAPIVRRNVAPDPKLEEIVE